MSKIINYFCLQKNLNAINWAFTVAEYFIENNGIKIFKAK